MDKYNSVTPQIIEKLRSIAGEKNVITDSDAKEPYSHDETLRLKSMPVAVVRPADTAQVSAVMRLAFSEKIAVTPRGAGTGLSGGAVPVCGGIVLSLERLNKILEIDTENLMVVTQPSVINGDIQKAVEEKGLFYPPDPASLESCFIGGNIAENAGGPRAFKYGVTREYLCGLEAVWPDGKVSRLGGKLLKNVAGYDLLSLICGSEGTLAVITEITLSLLPKPPVEVDLLIPFPSIEQAVKASTEIIKARILPATMEFMEKKAVWASESLLGKEAPFRNAEAHLLIQLDGAAKSQLESDYEKIGEIVSQFEAIDVLVAEDKSSKERLWEMRRAISDALSEMRATLSKEDVVVPRAKIPELFAGLNVLREKHDVEIISFGHIGDGNVHVNVLKKETDGKPWEQRSAAFFRELFGTVLALGGTITGEHGIGCIKKDYLPMAVDGVSLRIMKEIKNIIDPSGILNPGKIFNNTDCNPADNSVPETNIRKKPERENA